MRAPRISYQIFGKEFIGSYYDVYSFKILQLTQQRRDVITFQREASPLDFDDVKYQQLAEGLSRVVHLSPTLASGRGFLLVSDRDRMGASKKRPALKNGHTNTAAKSYGISA